MHPAEALVPEPSPFESEIADEKLKDYKSWGIDQIPAELIRAECNTLCSKIHILINCIWKREELPQQWKESIIVPVCKNGDLSDHSNYRGILLLPTTYKILSVVIV
jgi:hypothetical protein